MDLSVVVCTYNRSRLLEGNLLALGRQVTPPELRWEVVVVDNNCTDDTASVIERAVERFPVALSRVTESEQGLCNARNRGISATRGRYIAFTDDDTRPYPNWVEQIWFTFKKWNCGAVAGRVKLELPGQRPRWLVDDLLSSLAHVDYGNSVRVLDSPEQPFLGANMAIAREVFGEIGVFKPGLDRVGKKLVGGGDTDLYERIIDAKIAVMYQPLASVQHLIEPERLHKTYFRKLYYYGGQVHGQQYDKGRCAQLCGIPLFGFRKLVNSGWNFAANASREGLDPVFKQELNVWWHWGFLTGCFKASRADERQC